MAPILRSQPPLRKGVINLLAISGGADDGAFGAGLLAGWSEAGSRPQFDLVTGVSSGALIAPFAFIGKERDRQLREIFTSYERKDIFSYSAGSVLKGSALVDNTPLANLIEYYVDDQFLKEIARERAKGRVLLIGTTNLDAQRPVLWDVGRIAMSGTPEAAVLFRKILLASAAIPGVFPSVRIDVHLGDRVYEEMHVDGGVTRHVFLAPQKLLAGPLGMSSISGNKKRLYIIRNGKTDPEWQSVSETMLSVTRRSVSTLIKNQGVGDLYRMYASAQSDGIEFNLASIPSDFKDVESKPFDQKYMTALFGRGYQLGRDGYPWVKTPPGIERVARSTVDRVVP
jgi:predicted acylesterase/phospholipase RssA